MLSITMKEVTCNPVTRGDGRFSTAPGCLLHQKETPAIDVGRRIGLPGVTLKGTSIPYLMKDY